MLSCLTETQASAAVQLGWPLVTALCAFPPPMHQLLALRLLSSLSRYTLSLHDAMAAQNLVRSLLCLLKSDEWPGHVGLVHGGVHADLLTVLRHVVRSYAHVSSTAPGRASAEVSDQW